MLGLILCFHFFPRNFLLTCPCIYSPWLICLEIRYPQPVLFPHIKHNQWMQDSSMQILTLPTSCKDLFFSSRRRFISLAVKAFTIATVEAMMLLHFTMHYMGQLFRIKPGNWREAKVCGGDGGLPSICCHMSLVEWNKAQRDQTRRLLPTPMKASFVFVLKKAGSDTLTVHGSQRLLWQLGRKPTYVWHISAL